MRYLERRILVVPNEDGFGPSALASYIVRALLENRENQITIWNKSRLAYNRSLYEDAIAAGRVRLWDVWNLIQLDKKMGEVSIQGTLRRVGEYRALSHQYPFDPPDTNFDVVIDIGVPAAVRWAVRTGIKSVTVFDHCWSKTLQMILADEDMRQLGVPRPSDPFRALWHLLVDEIRRDELLTQKLFLFPRFITPDIFYKHWEAMIPKSAIHEMGSVLGGSTSKGKAMLNLKEAIGHFQSGKVIMIQGGDTPAWDSLLPNLVDAFLKHQDELERRNLTVVIYLPTRLRTNPMIARVFCDPPPERVRGFGPLKQGTIQTILPAFNFLVTRAGGGTVNDAVACRVPFVCVEETTMSQVQEILQACEDRGLTRRILWDKFTEAPMESILLEYDGQEANKAIVQEMKGIPSEGEKVVVSEVEAL